MEAVVGSGVPGAIEARVVDDAVWCVLHVVGAVVDLVHLELHVIPSLATKRSRLPITK